MPGARCTRGPCAKCSEHTVVTTGTPDTRHSLRKEERRRKKYRLINAMSLLCPPLCPDPQKPLMAVENFQRGRRCTEVRPGVPVRRPGNLSRGGLRSATVQQ
jgi:hypothetical protein